MKDYTKLTQGAQVDVSGPRDQTLTAGESSTLYNYDPAGVSALTMGTIKTLSGHVFHAILDINISDGCELQGVYILVPDGEEYHVLAVQQKEKIQEIVDNILVFPFHYMYYDEEIRGKDIHIDPETGWSL